MSGPPVSIIVPCYNLAEFLPETCESILAQTYKQWECVLIDDGSTDQTESVAKAYCAKDNRFKFMAKANGGPASARNAGIRNTAGEFILPWDGDDIFDSGFLELAVKILQSDARVGFVACYVELFGEETRLLTYSRSGGPENYVVDNNTSVSCLMRRKVWEDAGGYDESMRDGYEDWDFWLSATARGWLCHVIEKPLFKYRKRARSRYEASLRRRPEHIKHLVEKHKDVFGAHVVEAVYGRELNIDNQNRKIDSLLNSRDYRWGRKLLVPFRAAKRAMSVLQRKTSEQGDPVENNH